MRSYGQYCALARALDVIGDRWTLLIVRELLIRGSCRYTDLRDGLPGIATNLLADRVRDLEEAAIVQRADGALQLTPRGEELRPIVHLIGRWGAPLLGVRHRNDAFRTHWLALPAGLHLKDSTPARPPVTIEVRTGDEPMTIETVDGGIRMRPGAATNPDAVLIGKPRVILGILTGQLDVSAARCEGNVQALRRVLPEKRVPTKNRRATS